MATATSNKQKQNKQEHKTIKNTITAEITNKKQGNSLQLWFELSLVSSGTAVAAATTIPTIRQEDYKKADAATATTRQEGYKRQQQRKIIKNKIKNNITQHHKETTNNKQ